MSNGAACCVLGICCDAFSNKPMEALAEEMAHGGLAPEVAKKAAGWVLDNYDLAPKNTLGPFVKAITRLAREKPGPQKDA